jgi:hypothetical protein
MQVQGERFVKAKMNAPVVNGVDLNGKLILNNTNEQQAIKKVVVNDVASVEHLKFGYINEIDCDKFSKAFGCANYTTNLTIKGSVVFNFQPRITSLNGEHLEKLYSNIWIENRDVWNCIGGYSKLESCHS